MEKINTNKLFEKYRKIIDGEKRTKLSGWDENSSVEEYIKEEGYGHGVVLFLENIKSVTDSEFIVHSVTDSEFIVHSVKRDLKYEDSYDTTYDKYVFKRIDGKLFKCDVCVEFGRYSENMLEDKTHREFESH